MSVPRACANLSELQESFGVAHQAQAQSRVPQYSLREHRGRVMLIYLFQDESDNDIFAFSIDMTGANISAVTPQTEWIFLEALDTLKFPNPWDITDFQGVLDHLKADGYYVFVHRTAAKA
jgi:hypothetical protein